VNAVKVPLRREAARANAVKSAPALSDLRERGQVPLRRGATGAAIDPLSHGSGLHGRPTLPR